MSSECESERCQGHLWPHFQQLVSSWRIVPRLAGPFKCLPISGSINKQACLLGRIRNEGETEAILLHVRQELCWNKHLSTPTNDRREREREADDRARRERGHQLKEKWISLSNFFPPSPSCSSLLPTPPFSRCLKQLNLSKLHSKAGICSKVPDLLLHKPDTHLHNICINTLHW